MKNESSSIGVKKSIPIKKLLLVSIPILILVVSILISIINITSQDYTGEKVDKINTEVTANNQNVVTNVGNNNVDSTNVTSLTSTLTSVITLMIPIMIIIPILTLFGRS